MNKKIMTFGMGLLGAVFAFSMAACAPAASSGSSESATTGNNTGSIAESNTASGDSGNTGSTANTYTFEAEDTYVANIKGGNWSSNPTGKNCVVKDENGSWKASNGYFVGSLSQQDATVEFEITSDKAVEGVELTIRISSNTYAFTLSSDPTSNQYYTIEVNGVAIDYGTISVTANAEFKDITLGNISLKAADEDNPNTITFTTTNKYSPTSGIFAAAPAIDCIYLKTDSDAKIAQVIYDGNYTK
jgi:hypothetical protein